MSSKTRKASERKIKSEHRLLLLGTGAIIIAGLALWFFAAWKGSQLKVPEVTLQNISRPKLYCLKLQEQQQGCNSDLEVADIPEARAQGLSGRYSLTGSKGMVFVFESADQQCMWMKDMRFSIDMVWLNTEKQITKIERKVSPESYPQTFCSTGRYVIELPAGKSDNLQLKAGQKLFF